MALSKNVQRSLDPNNKFWAEDTSRFGYKLLQKYGWQGKGLGANEDGITSHIKVAQKQDSKGVGTSDNPDPWLQNTTSYDNALARLKNLGKSTPPPQQPTASTTSLFVKSSEEYATTDKPAPKHYIPPRVKKHKLAKYSEEEMRGIFAKGTSLPPTPVETGPTGRFSAPPVEEELDKYTVTSSLSIFDYFASKKAAATEPSVEDVAVPEESESRPAEDAEPSNKKKRKRESTDLDKEESTVTTETASKKKKKSKREENDTTPSTQKEDEASMVIDQTEKKEESSKKDKKKDKKVKKDKKEKKDKKSKKDKSRD